MGKEENAKIIRRVETFRRMTGMRKAVRSILVSPSGLKPGKYSGNVMAVVSGEDLFAEVTE